ncbi:hypothetical protein DL89DRAFT_111435 [Linderina pennispora]|uniref:Uncharacterized protein n=1 Tax=Linderina pennispora TaxID=61395 RepID=A0A1Y1WGE2_9FUNG|nr:uncharacterized protein DL89DRAFT_111435 [Linderina pennispora]ORX72296.1 hypothetical protein DL89DRAFT_111435 [Linderina pennispora]
MLLDSEQATLELGQTLAIIYSSTFIPCLCRPSSLAHSGGCSDWPLMARAEDAGRRLLCTISYVIPTASRWVSWRRTFSPAWLWPMYVPAQQYHTQLDPQVVSRADSVPGRAHVCIANSAWLGWSFTQPAYFSCAKRDSRFNMTIYGESHLACSREDNLCGRVLLLSEWPPEKSL